MIKVVIFYPHPNETVNKAINRINKVDLRVATIKDSSELRNLTFDVLLMNAQDSDLLDSMVLPKSKVLFWTENNKNLDLIYQKARKHKVFSVISLDDFAKIEQIIKKAYDQLLKDFKEYSNENKAIAITSFKSGVGKSLISFNLSFHLTKYLKENQILLVDQSSPFGAAKPILNVDTTFSWHTIRPLLIQKKIPNESRLEGVSLETRYNFKLLCHPLKSEHSHFLSKKENHNLIESSKKINKLTIVDSPTIDSIDKAKALQSMDKIFVILTPDLTTIYNTFKGLELIKDKVEITDKIHYVLNNYDQDIDKNVIQSIEDRMGIDILSKIEFDPSAVRHFMQNYRLFDDIDLVITKDLSQLAEKIFKILY